MKFHSSLNRWNGTWISDSSFIYLDTMGSIKIYNCDTLKEDLLFNRNIIQQGDVGHGLVSPTARYVLIPIKKDKDAKVIHN